MKLNKKALWKLHRHSQYTLGFILTESNWLLQGKAQHTLQGNVIIPSFCFCSAGCVDGTGLEDDALDDKGNVLRGVEVLGPERFLTCPFFTVTGLLLFRNSNSRSSSFLFNDGELEDRARFVCISVLIPM